MSGTRTSPPISSHPAFPAAVTLWFAALLGLPFLVIPPAMLDNIVALAGAEALLGDSARLAFAGAGAVLGILLGLFVVWRIASSRGEIDAEPEVVRAPVMADIDAPTEEGETAEIDDADDPTAQPAEDERCFHGQAEDGDNFSARDRWREDMTPAAVAPDTCEANDDERADELPSEEMHDVATTAEEDDEQRRAADMLVAGLPRISREGLDAEPAAQWLRYPDEDGEEEIDHVPGGEIALEVEGPSSALADDSVEAPTGDTRPIAGEDLASLGLDQLVARLERAMEDVNEASTAPDGGPVESRTPEASEDADPVIAFLRREAVREGHHGPRPVAGESGGGQAGLRSALERLNRVNSRGRD